MHLKIPLQNRDLELSNSKLGCRVSALHFFVRSDSTNGFLTLTSFREVRFVAFFIYFRFNPCFNAGKQIGVFKLPRSSQTLENDLLDIHSLLWRHGDSMLISQLLFLISKLLLLNVGFFIENSKLTCLSLLALCPYSNNASPLDYHFHTNTC